MPKIIVYNETSKCQRKIILRIRYADMFISYRNVVVYGTLGTTLMSLVLFLYLSHLQTSESTQLGRSAPGQIIANSRIIRLAIFLISNTLIAVCAVFSVVSLFLIALSLINKGNPISRSIFCHCMRRELMYFQRVLCDFALTYINMGADSIWGIVQRVISHLL